MSITKAAMYGGDLSYEVANSGAFAAEQNSYLSRTFGVPTDRDKWTYSTWIKKSSNLLNSIFNAGTTVGDRDIIRMNAAADSKLYVYGVVAASTSKYFQSHALYRDVGEFYHLVISVDKGNAIPSERLQVWVNGIQINSDSGMSAVTSSTFLKFNASGVAHYIGFDANTGYMDGYMSEAHFIDGQALTPDYFAESDPRTRQWNPKKYIGSFGSNGFYLNFEDGTNLGKDSSGNGNHFTNNAVTQSLDTPTDNHCTFNTVFKYLSTVTPSVLNAGRSIETTASGNQFIGGTVAASSGKYYYEVLVVTHYPGWGYFAGLLNPTSNNGLLAWRTDGYLGGSLVTATTIETYTAGDRLGVAFDLDNNKVELYKNGTLVKEITNSDDGLIFDGDVTVMYQDGATISTAFEGDYFFTGDSWIYTPPSGFKPLSTKNLPEPKVAKPRQYFKPVVYTGNQTAGHKVTAGFQPDLVWIKDRTRAERHIITDSVNGAGTYLESNTTDSLATGEFDKVESIDADGFTVGASGPTNFIGDDFVAWCWKKGEIPGFDIVNYIGDGVAGRSLNHSLGSKPRVMMVKNLDGTNSWNIYHTSVTATDFILLNSSNASTTTSAWNSAEPTATNFTVGSGGGTNGSGQKMIAYLFAEVDGFSKFGSYVGNGNDDGTFMYCGFRPAYLLIKRVDAADNWHICDAARSDFNPFNDVLRAHLSNTESPNHASFDVDGLSNGFKVRSTNSELNASGGEYIFMAFAEVPFKYSRAR